MPDIANADHRDDPYVYEDDRDGFDGIRRRGDRYIAMKVEKQRQGTTGVVSVIFQPNRMRYLQIERQIQPPTRADRRRVDGITYSVTV